MKGAFISFEGGEGSGKSTQLKLLQEAFARSGRPALFTREPGGCANAEAIRQLLVAGTHEAYDALSETLLFYAARVEHVAKTIKPAMAEGKTVICDRFADSTLVYQGYAKGLGEAYIQQLHGLLLGDFRPQLTFIFDIDPLEGLRRARLRAGSETRFEELDIEFHHKVRAGFLAVAKREPARCVVVDAMIDPDEIRKIILRHLSERFGLSL